MFVGPQFPNNEPDPNQPNMGIHPAPPSELTPQLGKVVHPNDAPGTEQANLPPPATAGAEQDMRPANHDVPERIGAVAIPAANTEPSAQPEEPGDDPQPPKSADAPESPETPAAAGGDGPADPPEPPIAPHEGMFPEREPVPAPDLHALSEREPVTIEEAITATTTLQNALAAALAKHAEHTTPDPFAKQLDGQAIDLTVRTHNGYYLLWATPEKLTIEKQTFKPESDLEATDSASIDFYPTETYTYVLLEDGQGPSVMVRSHSLKDFSNNYGGMSYSEEVLRLLDERNKNDALEAEMPGVSLRKLLNADEATAVAAILEKAEPDDVSFQGIRDHILKRSAQGYSVSDIDAEEGAVELEAIVDQALQSPEFHSNPTPTTHVERELEITTPAHPEKDQQATTTIKVGRMAVEPPALMDILSSDTTLQIPDTIEGIEEAATPPTSPFISVEVTMKIAGASRADIELRLRGQGTLITPDNNLKIMERQILAAKDGKFALTYEWDVLVDGERANIGSSTTVPGDRINTRQIKRYLRQARYYDEIADWFVAYRASQQKPEAPE
jgi:hypothetical protein